MRRFKLVLCSEFARLICECNGAMPLKGMSFECTRCGNKVHRAAVLTKVAKKRKRDIQTLKEQLQ